MSEVAIAITLLAALAIMLNSLDVINIKFRRGKQLPVTRRKKPKQLKE
jgi:hypothetical protein